MEGLIWTLRTHLWNQKELDLTLGLMDLLPPYSWLFNIPDLQFYLQNRDNKALLEDQ